jgi:hypothetical protein
VIIDNTGSYVPLHPASLTGGIKDLVVEPSAILNIAGNALAVSEPSPTRERLGGRPRRRPPPPPSEREPWI